VAITCRKTGPDFMSLRCLAKAKFPKAPAIDAFLRFYPAKITRVAAAEFVHRRFPFKSPPLFSCCDAAPICEWPEASASTRGQFFPRYKSRFLILDIILTDVAAPPEP
jgi:hypothetical protein